jgi:hypothetical protein
MKKWGLQKVTLGVNLGKIRGFGGICEVLYAQR